MDPAGQRPQVKGRAEKQRVEGKRHAAAVTHFETDIGSWTQIDPARETMIARQVRGPDGLESGFKGLFMAMTALAGSAAGAAAAGARRPDDSADDRLLPRGRDLVGRPADAHPADDSVICATLDLAHETERGKRPDEEWRV